MLAVNVQRWVISLSGYPTLLKKCNTIAAVAKEHGVNTRDQEPEVFDYYGVEVVWELGTMYIMLPFVLNVSVTGHNVVFLVGNKHILDCLYKKISLISDI